VNAADYGIPQKRERVFIVGFRSDLEIDWSFPSATHSEDALLHDQWITGSYWDRHKISTAERPSFPARQTERIRRLAAQPPLWPLKPWRTVRDALCDLPDPESAAAKCISDHRYQPGARAYPGHTGSPLDLPAKAIKAGGHGVPGGENMMVKTDGSFRYFTARETARIQTFPDGYVFHGSWSETMRQLGNAVPVALARVVGASVAESLIERKLRDCSALVQSQEKAA
jgi:DNA (cytosine-5)-methyltransferase 1